MKRIIAFLSLILVLSAFCGCSGAPVGFQDVENIATVDFMFDDGGKYNYSFDPESGVFSADCLDESTEYVLEQTEIEAIRAAIEPVGKWPGDFRYSSAGYNYPQKYISDTPDNYYKRYIHGELERNYNISIDGKIKYLPICMCTFVDDNITLPVLNIGQ